MDREGSWRDNVFMERFWWSLKYEHVYLHAYEDLRSARQGIAAYVEYYNNERQHLSLDKLTPVQAYEQNPIVATSSSPTPTDRLPGIPPSQAW